MTSRMHFQIGRSTGKGAYRRKGSISRVMVASRQNVSDQMAASVSEIMDGSLYATCQFGLSLSGNETLR
jgi:hypothetical protein